MIVATEVNQSKLTLAGQFYSRAAIKPKQSMLLYSDNRNFKTTLEQSTKLKVLYK